ncbi:pogo transposable element with KRAB domain-like protein [Turdus rufiventris]|nr:pogo transposable element with KRAB domain-like protein [Turdus rufiventris]
MAPQRRVAYDADFKLKAINHAKEHGNRSASREFNINESMVRKWRKQEDDLCLAKKTKKSFRGNKAKWPQLEDRLERWISEQRAAGRSFSGVAVRIQAKAIANEMGIEDFKAGPSWCFRFMKRRQLSIRTWTTVSQQCPADYEEKLANFRSYCKSKISEKNIQPDHIINMDEVPLTFDMPLTKTVERTGTATVPVRTTGNEKTSFTVVLSVLSNGQKLPPMVIFKRETLPEETFPAGIIVEVNPKGRMDEEIMKNWLAEVYVQRPDGFFHASPALLVYDSMRAHKTKSVKALVEKMNSELAVIPGDFTEEVQPLDISIIRSFKAKLQLTWENWMLEGERSFTKTRRQRQASYATVCQWILDAWHKISARTVIQGFVKADIIPELTSDDIESTDTDDSEDEDTGDTSSSSLDAGTAQSMISDTEDEECKGFTEDE